jgi:WD40-like Beta Propeller Repeat
MRPGLAPPRPAVTVLLAVMLTALPVRLAKAQADPSGHWRTWHTPHFRVHARVQDRLVARRAALQAERAYALLAQELVPPRGTIDLVLHDNADFSNGFTSVFPSPRIDVYLTPPAGDPQLARYDDWLRLVITHELTHAFHLDRTRGVWRLAQDVMGRAPGSFPNEWQPSWVKEGLAEYYESRLTTSGRLRGGMQDELLAAAARGGQWPRPGDATLLSPRWPAGYLPYAWGDRFFATEEAAAGDSVVPRFVEAGAAQLWPFATSRALRHAGGMGVERVWSAMRAHWDSLAHAGAAGSVVVRGLRAAPRPHLSPDGARLAYVEVTGRTDAHVVVRDLASGRAMASHRVTGQVHLAWLGDTVLVSQLEFTSPVTLREALYRWVPGRSWGRVPGSRRLARPFTGPDGAVMAVDVAAASDAVVRLGGGKRVALPLPDGDAWSYLATSPDGRWLAGARHRDGQWDIVAWPTGRPQDAIAVTSDQALDDDPTWSPTGDRVLFASERGGLSQILAYSINDRTLRRLTDAPAGARQPALARDGTLYYATFLWDGWAIARARPLALEPVAPPARAVLGRDTILTTTMRETSYRPWPSLLPHYWLPTWHRLAGGDWFVGARTTGVDAIGRTAYLAQVAVSPQRGRIEYQLDVTHQRWRATSLSASVTQTWDAFAALSTLSNGDTVTIGFGKRDLLAGLGVQRDWRRWRALVSARVEGLYEHTAYTIDSSRIAGVQLTKDHYDFVGAAATLSAQALSYPALAISPENGIAAGARYQHDWETTGPGWWNEWRGVAAAYLALPLPGFAHWVLAARAAAGVRDGPSADPYDLGGASGDPYEIVPGYVVGPGRRTFPLRGYPVTSVGYTRAAVGALELRVPVALVARGVGKLPLGLDRISLTGFAEAGGGWRAGDSPDAFALRDAGGELVVDGGVPQDAPIRVRVGVAVPLVAGLGVAAGAARGYAAFGTAF